MIGKVPNPDDIIIEPLVALGDLQLECCVSNRAVDGYTRIKSIGGQGMDVLEAMKNDIIGSGMDDEEQEQSTMTWYYTFSC